MARTVILDIDGTLVDSNYQHAIAWHRALRAHGHSAQLWRIHRHIGMGGDQIVAALVGDEVEERDGDAIRETEAGAYAEMIDEVEVMDGAPELVAGLAENGASVVLASSAKSEEVDRYLEMLDARERVDGWTTAADVERTKPAPDLLQAALEKAGGPAPEEALMIGDSVWDVKAASAAGIGTLAVLTGGFSEEELREAGATDVVREVAELLAPASSFWD